MYDFNTCYELHFSAFIGWCINLLLRIQHQVTGFSKNVYRVEGNGKGKDRPRTGHEGPEGEYKYSSTLSLTSALDGVDGQRHAPAALPPGKTRYPLYRRLSGPQERSGQLRKVSPPPTGIWSPDRPARSELL